MSPTQLIRATEDREIMDDMVVIVVYDNTGPL